MAKNPTVLWYWSDWHSGTTTLSRFLKGCYMDLLHAQFNSGPLSLEEVKTVLSSDFGAAWPTLIKKFSINPEGLFFNERMEAEKIKRKAFTKSRIGNLKGGKTPHMDHHMGNHMGVHMDNVNRNVNKDLKEKGVQGERVDPVVQIKSPIQTDYTEYPDEVLAGWKLFEQWLLNNTPDVQKMEEPITIKNYQAHRQDFESPLGLEIFKAMHNWKPLLGPRGRKSANLTFDNWFNDKNNNGRISTAISKQPFAGNRRSNSSGLDDLENTFRTILTGNTG